MARYVMVLRGATSLQGALEGPTPSNAPSNDVALSISAIKTTGTLVVLCTRVLLLCVRGVGRSPCSSVV